MTAVNVEGTPDALWPDRLKIPVRSSVHSMDYEPSTAEQICLATMADRVEQTAPSLGLPASAHKASISSTAKTTQSTVPTQIHVKHLKRNSGDDEDPNLGWRFARARLAPEKTEAALKHPLAQVEAINDPTPPPAQKSPPASQASSIQQVLSSFPQVNEPEKSPPPFPQAESGYESDDTASEHFRSPNFGHSHLSKSDAEQPVSQSFRIDRGSGGFQIREPSPRLTPGRALPIGRPRPTPTYHPGNDVARSSENLKSVETQRGLMPHPDSQATEPGWRGQQRQPPHPQDQRVTESSMQVRHHRHTSERSTRQDGDDGDSGASHHVIMARYEAQSHHLQEDVIRQLQQNLEKKERLIKAADSLAKERKKMIEEGDKKIRQRDEIIEERNKLIAEHDSNLFALHESFEKAKKDAAAKEALLLNQQTLKAQYETKIKKFQDYFKGLGNDMNSQREQFLRMRSDQDEMRRIGEKQDAVKTSSSIEQEQQLHSFRMMLDNLKQELVSHTSSLNEQNVANAELARTLKSSFVSVNEQTIGQHQMMLKKLNDLVIRLQTSPPINDMNADSNSILQKCYEGVQSLVDRNFVQPSDLQELATSMGGYANEIQQSLYDFNESQSRQSRKDRILAQATNQQVVLLAQNCPNATVLQAEVAHHREEKAMIKEELRGNEAKLTEANFKIEHLRASEDDKRTELQNLKQQVTALSAQLRDSPEVQIRIATLRADLRDREAFLEAAELRIEELQRQEDERQAVHEQLQTEMSGLQLQLEAANAKHRDSIASNAEATEKLKSALEKDLANTGEAGEQRLLSLRRRWENDEKTLRHELDTAQQRLELLESEAQKAIQHVDTDGDMLANIRAEMKRMKADLEQKLNQKDAELAQNKKIIDSLERQSGDLRSKLQKARTTTMTRATRHFQGTASSKDKELAESQNESRVVFAKPTLPASKNLTRKLNLTPPQELTVNKDQQRSNNYANKSIYFPQDVSRASRVIEDSQDKHPQLGRFHSIDREHDDSQAKRMTYISDQSQSQQSGGRSQRHSTSGVTALKSSQLSGRAESEFSYIGNDVDEWEIQKTPDSGNKSQPSRKRASGSVDPSSGLAKRPRVVADSQSQAMKASSSTLQSMGRESVTRLVGSSQASIGTSRGSQLSTSGRRAGTAKVKKEKKMEDTFARHGGKSIKTGVRK